MRLREKNNFIKIWEVIFFFCIKIFFLPYIEGNGGNRWTSLEPSNVNEEMLLLELTQSIIFFPFYVPRQYVLNTSKQFLNHFSSKYEMLWETFCNSEMVTSKFLSTKEAIKGTHTRTHIHSGNCPYASSRNTPSGKQTQPCTRKGSFKARITFPTTSSLSYQKSSQTFKLKREENPKTFW